MSFGTKYFGGKIDETEAWTCEPMPHIEDGFTLVFNIQNWDRRHELLRNIFDRLLRVGVPALEVTVEQFFTRGQLFFFKHTSPRVDFQYIAQ